MESARRQESPRCRKMSGCRCLTTRLKNVANPPILGAVFDVKHQRIADAKDWEMSTVNHGGGRGETRGMRLATRYGAKGIWRWFLAELATSQVFNRGSPVSKPRPTCLSRPSRFIPRRIPIRL